MWSSGLLKIDADWHLFFPLPILHHLSCVIFANTAVVAFWLLRSSGFNFHKPQPFKKMNNRSSVNPYSVCKWLFILPGTYHCFIHCERQSHKMVSINHNFQRKRRTEGEWNYSLSSFTAISVSFTVGGQCHKTVSINHNFWGDRAKGDSNYSFDGFALYLAPASVSFTVGGRVTRRCQSTTTFEEIEERRRPWSIHSLQMAFYSTWHLSIFHLLIIVFDKYL